jgi:hypothetical protein
MPCLAVGMTSGFGADGCATTILYKLTGYKDGYKSLRIYAKSRYKVGLNTRLETRIQVWAREQENKTEDKTEV